MTVLVVHVALFSSLGLDKVTEKKIANWSEISILKLIFTNEFVRI